MQISSELYLRQGSLRYEEKHKCRLKLSANYVGPMPFVKNQKKKNGLFQTHNVVAGIISHCQSSQTFHNHWHLGIFFFLGESKTYEASDSDSAMRKQIDALCPVKYKLEIRQGSQVGKFI